MSDKQGSARVTLREIDLSQVRDPEQLPQGVPAAVVGPAKRGPAFVPKTFADMQQFGEVFGSMQEISKDSNANRFAPLALNEWMRNAQAGTFLRVLGVGSDEGRINSDKTVTGAGFVVGDKVSHDANNELQNNLHAHLDAQELEQATEAGRTHLLGCFMRDVAGSTFLQDAGVQTSTAAGVAQIRFAAQPSIGDFITLKFINPNDTTQSTTSIFEFGQQTILNSIQVNIGGNISTTVDNLKSLIEINDGNYNIAPTISEEGDANNGPHTIEILQQAEGEVGNTVIDYQFNPAGGDINDITVNGQTASSAVQDYVLGIIGDVAGQCVMTISDLPVNNSTILLDGLSNDGDGTVSADNPVTFTFITAGILSTQAGADGVADRYEATGVSTCSVHIADTKEETLQNLAAAINRPAANTGGALLNTSGLLVAELFNNNTQLRVTQVNGGAASAGASGCDIVLSVTDTKLSVSAADSLTLTSTGANKSGKFANGADGSVASFKLALSGQPLDGEEISIEVVSDPDTPTVESKTFIFKDVGVNGDDAGGNDAGKVLVKIDANGDVERTLYNLYDTIVGDDANPARGGALAEVAAKLSITTVGNGNVATNDLAGAKINLVSHDGTSVDYILTDSANAGQATGTELQEGDEVSSGTGAVANLTAGATGIAVQIEVGASTHHALLVQLKAAIEGGPHAGKITVSDVPDEAAQALTILLTQVKAGFTGNKSVTRTGIDDITAIGAEGATNNQFDGGEDGFSSSSVDVLPDEDAIEFKQLQNISLIHKLTTSSLKMGDRAVITNPDGDRLVGNFGQKSTAFEGGGGAAAPVIRGLLMTPQGVIPALEQNSALYSSNTSGNHLSKVTLNDSAFKTFGIGVSKLSGYEIGSISDDQSFTVILNGLDSDEESSVLSCSFDPESVNYFAKVLNTDPLQIESRGHYLYMHWDIDKTKATPSDVGLIDGEGALADLTEAAFCMHTSLGRATRSATIPDLESFDTRFRTAVSPWFVSQKFGDTTYDLFKIHALDDGDVANDRFRILISNIRAAASASDWGSFDLSLEAFESDPVKGEVIASWKRLSLDPDSRNFIGRVIGTKHMYFDFDRASSKQRLVEEGEFDVRNKYIRVELSDLVASGEVPNSSLVAGFKGYTTLNTTANSVLVESGDDGNGNNKLLAAASLNGVQPLPLPFVKKITRKSGQAFEASEALAWGVKFGKYEKSSELNDIRFNPSMKSWTMFLPDIAATDEVPAGVESEEMFSLEKIAVDDASDIDWSTSEYVRSGTSTKQFITLSDAAAIGKNVKYLKFRCLMQGGFDGVNIFNKDKAELTSAGAYREANEEVANVFTGPTVVAYQKAIDVLKDKSATEFQLLAIPGMREPLVTNYAITACESRFDAMFVMDIEQKDESDLFVLDTLGKPSVSLTIDRFEARRLDTSFAAAYFPDVVMRRPSNSSPLQVPPSVSMLGVMSQNDTLADPWFAPAGLTRGRLNALHSKVQMNRELLNDLYDADINPIYEPAGREGQVYAFGQKTLMQDQSALDRINVRRLLINIRRRVKAVANTLLFEPNRASTLARFSSLVEPIMSEVQARQGVERYKVQIDTSTTTQNDVENNTIRGKIYLQPTKSVEFISLDFVVTNSID